jgi:hypothetical protein
MQHWHKGRGLKQKLLSRKRIKDLGCKQPLCPRNERTFSWTYRKTIDSVKITKEKAGSHAASQKIKDWTLWRGRPPPKRKKKRVEWEQVRWKHWPPKDRKRERRPYQGAAWEEHIQGGNGGSSWHRGKKNPEPREDVMSRALRRRGTVIHR